MKVTGYTGLGLGILTFLSTFIDPRSKLGKQKDELMWNLSGIKVVEEKEQKIQPLQVIYYQFSQTEKVEEVKAKFDVLDDEKNVGLVFVGCGKVKDEEFEMLEKYLEDENNRLSFTRSSMHYDGPVATMKYPNYQNFAVLIFNKNREKSFSYNLTIYKKLWNDWKIIKKKIQSLVQN